MQAEMRNKFVPLGVVRCACQVSRRYGGLNDFAIFTILARFGHG